MRSRLVKNGFASVAATCALLLAPAAAQGETIVVDTPGDLGTGCTLRNAVESADNDNDQAGHCATAGNGDDMVQVPASVGPEIGLNQEIVAGGGTGTLTIQGPGANTVAASATGNFRVFQIVGTVEISGLTIANGAVTGVLALGGGVLVGATGNLTLDHVTVDNNGAAASAANDFPQARGGGIYAAGPLTVRDSTIRDNAATATLTAGGPTNSAFAAGGGIDAGQADLTIERSSISGNDANGIAPPTGTAGSFGVGGGVVFDDQADVNDALVRRTTVSGNGVSAVVNPPGAGGMIVTTPAPPDSGTRTLESNTITANTSSNVANLIAFRATIQNTLVSDPRGGGTNCPTDPGFDVTSGGFNLEETTDTCGFDQATDQPGVPSAGLDPNLASNGGPTPTHALLPASPAIDNGNSFGETIDQRGLLRPFDFTGLANAAGGDGADIGAFEVQQACAGQATPSTACGPTPPITPPTTPPAATPAPTSVAPAPTPTGENAACAGMRAKLKKTKSKRAKRKIRRKLRQLGC